jgi:hypothetical protein
VIRAGQGEELLVEPSSQTLTSGGRGDTEEVDVGLLRQRWRAEADEERRQVTVVFAHQAGSVEVLQEQPRQDPA